MTVHGTIPAIRVQYLLANDAIWRDRIRSRDLGWSPIFPGGLNGLRWTGDNAITAGPMMAQHVPYLQVQYP